MKPFSKPRVLFITPEVTYLPETMGYDVKDVSAKAGGLADVSAALISTLHNSGIDIHVALPDYRTLFGHGNAKQKRNSQQPVLSNSLDERIHLAEDFSFYDLNNVYVPPATENTKNSLIFQREIAYHILPKVKPDLIHCNDWMTGLIPAMARRMSIPTLFTLHNLYSTRTTLAEIEYYGISIPELWHHLYFERYPSGYEESRETNPVELLTSGVFASHFTNTVSRTFLEEILRGRHASLNHGLRTELANKLDHGCASGILNAPDPSFNPASDKALKANYSPHDHPRGKKINKRFLQEKLKLRIDPKAPLFFWPSRLDDGQKGCSLLLNNLRDILSDYNAENLQAVLVADGEYTPLFREAIETYNLRSQVSLGPFDDTLQRLVYGAADFVLMPSVFEPCGLPQMIGAIYGALPVVHDTGGLHDTIKHMNVPSDTGNGFVFENHDTRGFRWALHQAIIFHALPDPIKTRQRKRIMMQSQEAFSYKKTAEQYIHLYETMLRRPLL